MSAQARRLGSVAVSALFFAAVTTINSAPANSSEKILHTFKGRTDGSAPWAGLVADGAGNLYGTTIAGGGGTGCDNGSAGCGTVFEISGRQAETILHAFAGGCDGAAPAGGLTGDGQGNFYGATESGGVCNDDIGYGTVFELTPDGAETVLYAFGGTTDGNSPSGTLARDGNGSLFGTTLAGGNMSGCGLGCGVVFELAPSGTESVIHPFQGGQDGSQPNSGVIIDSSGNLFGTTETGGGSGNCSGGCGTVFKISPDGTETVLYAFQGGTDGWQPRSSLITDSAGNLYGTTWAGGSAGDGTVFEITPSGSETILHSFQAGSDGSAPLAGLVIDEKRNLYGTTSYGGSNDCRHGGCGTVFEVTPKGNEKVLYAFLRGSDGYYPAATPLLGTHGDLYGTTMQGGKGNNGVVFELKK